MAIDGATATLWNVHVTRLSGDGRPEYEPPQLQISVSQPTIHAGQSILATLQITNPNDGPAAAMSNVGFQFDPSAFAPGLTPTAFVGASECGGVASSSGNLLTFHSMAIPASGTCTISVTLTGTAALVSSDGAGQRLLTSPVSGTTDGQVLTGAAASARLVTFGPEPPFINIVAERPFTTPGQPIDITVELGNPNFFASLENAGFDFDPAAFFGGLTVQSTRVEPSCGPNASITNAGTLHFLRNLTLVPTDGTRDSQCRVHFALVAPLGSSGSVRLLTSPPAGYVLGRHMLGTVNETSFTITPTDTQPPVLGGLSASVEHLLGQGPQPLDDTLTLTDPDSNALQLATVTIASGYDPAADRLAFVCPGAILCQFDPAAGMVTIAGGGEPQDYRAALESITFDTTSRVPGSRQVVYDLHDPLGNHSRGQLELVLDLPRAAPALGIVVTPGTARAGVDRVVTYSLTQPGLHHPATGIAFSHALSDSAPGVMAEASRLPAQPCGPGSALTAASGTIHLTGGELAAGETCRFDVTYHTETATTGTLSTVTSLVEAVSAGWRVWAPEASASWTIQPLEPLVFSMTVVPETATLDVARALRLTIRAPAGQGAATQIELDHDVAYHAPGITVDAARLPSMPCGPGSTVTIGASNSFYGLRGGTLAAGATCQFDIPLVLPPTLPADSYRMLTSPLGHIIAGQRLAAPAADITLFVVEELRDTTPPILTLPADITAPTDPGSATATVTFAVSASDDFDGDLSGAVTLSHPSGSAFGLGVTEVLAAVTDLAGNRAEGRFTITVQDREPPTITPPADLSVPVDPGASTATLDVTTLAVATDNADPAPSLSYALGGVALNGPHAFVRGTTTVTVTARDAAGNEGTAQFTVTVGDAEPPVISGLPADISVPTDPGVETAVVSWTEPTATDNVGVVSLDSSHAPGSTFPLGTTTVTYTARDAAGNEGTAQFNVTVGDAEPPVIAGLPADISVHTDPGVETAVVSWTEPTATDNVGVVSLDSSHAPGSTFPLGTTTVTYTARDAAGNEATAQFTVTVSLRPVDPGRTSVLASPDRLVANGNDQSLITVTLRDASGAPIGRGGTQVRLTTTLGALLPVTDHGDGTYTAMLAAGTRAGVAHVSVWVEGVDAAQTAVTFDVDSAYVTARFSEAAQAFSLDRMDRLIRTAPRGLRLDQRRGIEPGTRFDLDFSATQGGFASRFSLYGRFDQRPNGGLMVEDADPAQASRMGTLSAAWMAPDRSWYGWVEGAYSAWRDSGVTPDTGDYGVLHAGIDRLIHDRLAVGLAVSLDWTHRRSGVSDSQTGRGWLLGPYLAAEPREGLFVTARLAWGGARDHSTLDLYGTGVPWTGVAPVRRALVEASAYGSTTLGALTLTPQVDLGFATERIGSFAVSDGAGTALVPASRTWQANVGLSTQVEWDVWVLGQAARSFVSPRVDWQATSLQRRPHPTGSVELGLRTPSGSAWNGELSVEVDGLFDPASSGWTLRLSADRRF